MNPDSKSKIPVVIITGFLGSGKTTLLNFIVEQPHMNMTAIIINEFGEIGLDHLLVETSSEQIIEMNNGCICCTVRGDLQDKLGSLAMWLDTGRLPPVERVIVETTGLADPTPIMHTLMTDQHLLNRYRFSGVVTVVDAIAGSSSIKRFPEAVKQIAVADQLILSKKDLVESLSSWDNYLELGERIRQINPRAVVHEIANGEIDPNILIPHETDETEGTLADIAGWLSSAEESRSETECNDQPNAHGNDTNQSGIRTFSIKLEEPIDREEFNEFIQALVIGFGENLLRMKGSLNVENGSGQPAVVRGGQDAGGKRKGKEQNAARSRHGRTVENTEVVGVDACESRGADLSTTPSRPRPRRTRIDILFEKVVHHVEVEVKDCGR